MREKPIHYRDLQQEMQRQPWHGTRSETLWGSFAARSHAFALTQDDKGLGGKVNPETQIIEYRIPTTNYQTPRRKPGARSQ